VIEDHHPEESPFDDWPEEWDSYDDEHEPPAPPPWRKPVLIVTAAVTALAMALVPLYNVFFTRDVADNGLEVCGFDYCVVVEAVTEAGLDLTMSRLSTTFLDDTEAARLTDAATDHLDVASVGLEIVDDLEGRLGGLYDPSTREIRIERPARAWTVLHEVAHTRESGHGDGFQRVLIELARWAGSGG
jgi:hypothetical protein